MENHDWHRRAKHADLSIRHFINGQYELATENGANKKISPSNGELLYSFGSEDCAAAMTALDRAVFSARESFVDGRWRNQSVHHRKAVLNKLADLIEKNGDELALNECLDVGKPIGNALKADIPRSIATIRGAAESADKLLSPSGADGGCFSYQLRKPVGVVGGILGWNFPLRLATSKVGPALAMGNSLVLKPSEFTSLSTSRLAELAVEAGVPPGVFNVVNGKGATVGAAMTAHTDIDLLTFVGSSATGKCLMEQTGQSNMKRLILECGGKSPYIVFDDCPEDLDAIADSVVALAFPNQGALCVAGTRLLIQEKLKAKLLPKVLERAEKIVPKDPLSPDSTFGALINEDHMNKVLGFIERGKKDGANLILGGRRLMEETGGYYIGPTIFDRVDPLQELAQEEIFGPVLSVLTFHDEAEAIQLANNSQYGLAAYVATQDLARAQRLAQQLNAGYISICATTEPSGGVALGFEAHRQSGFGFEGGLDGLAAYTVCSTVNLLT